MTCIIQFSRCFRARGSLWTNGLRDRRYFGDFLVTWIVIYRFVYDCRDFRDNFRRKKIDIQIVHLFLLLESRKIFRGMTFPLFKIPFYWYNIRFIIINLRKYISSFLFLISPGLKILQLIHTEIKQGKSKVSLLQFSKIVKILPI